MNWFTRLCRQTGLTIHHIVKPVDSGKHTQQVSKRVEEEKVSPTVTLRRTTIEEIEIKRGSKGDGCI